MILDIRVGIDIREIGDISDCRDIRVIKDISECDIRV